MAKPPSPVSAPPGGFTAAEQAALTTQKERGSARTPRAILDAFFPPCLAVGDITLRPLSLGDLMLLEKIDSPLLDAATALDEGGIKSGDVANAVFLLALPFEKAMAVHGAGRAAWDEAVFVFASRVPAVELKALGEKIAAALAAGFATALPGGEKKTPATPASAGA